MGRGGVELPQGIDTPGVAELLRGDETPRVTTKGEGVPEDDGRGRGEDRNPPTTRATVESGASSVDEEMTQGRVWRSRRVHSGARRRMMTVWGPSKGILTAPTAPGPKRACNRVASMEYWRQRSRRAIQTPQRPKK